MFGVTGRVYIHLEHGQDVREHGKRYTQGLVDDASPYDFHLAHALGWTVTFSEDTPENSVTSFLRRGFARCLGFDSLHAYRNRRKVRECDVIWTMTEYEWLSLAMLQLLGIVPKRPMIGNSIWLFDKWYRLGALKKYLYRILARRCAVLTVHSNNCIPIAKTAFPHSNIQLMYFGISTSTYRITNPVKAAGTTGRLRILAIGKDKTRDWATFLASFGNNALFDLMLVCRWAPRKYETLYGNLKVKRSLAGKEFTGNYASSDIVAIPMRENVFSGIVVLLQAVASGIPVIASRTGGCPTYFGDNEVTYVPCNDPAAMREAALDLQSLREKAKKAQEKFLNRDYSTRGMIERYSVLTKQILVMEATYSGSLRGPGWRSERQERKLTPSRW